MMTLKITELLDDYPEEDRYLDSVPVPSTERIKEVTMKKLKTGRRIRPLRIALIAAAIAALLAGTALGVMQYSRYTELQEASYNALSETEMTEEQKDYVERQATAVGQSATDEGITITVDSLSCTSDIVHLILHYELDPEVYDVEKVWGCVESVEDSVSVETQPYIENEAFGTIKQRSGGGGNLNDYDAEDGLWYELRMNFDVPEDARINDGESVLHFCFKEIMVHSYDDAGESYEFYVQGTWSFDIPLPEEEDTGARTAEETLTLGLDSGQPVFVQNIAVDESGCSFDVTTENESYSFADETEAEMWREIAEIEGGDVYTVSAKLTDGTSAVMGAVSGTAQEDGSMYWLLSWAAPTDPETITSLVFSDGENEYEVSVSAAD